MFEQKSDKPTRLDHWIMGTGSKPVQPDSLRDRAAGVLGLAFVGAVAGVSRLCPKLVGRVRDASLGKDFQ